MKALLILEDGSVFEGVSSGVKTTKFGEVVFNTALTGYQEILTDPSYKGQFVTMTYPHIGNYGVNFEDFESEKIFLEGFIVKEISPVVSNYRAEEGLQEFLRKNNIIAVEGIDTRALTKKIREHGSMMAVLTNERDDIDNLLKELRAAPSIEGRDLVKEVTTKEIYVWDKKNNIAESIHFSNRYYDGISNYKNYSYNFNIVVIDCGVKYNILRLLSGIGNNRVTVVPADTDFSKIKELNPDGVLISNGPGDPSAVPYIVGTVKNIIENNIPAMGICFGHQLIGQALGGKTYKLKFGHHGANHPVMDLKTKKVEITSQNHNFCVDYDSLNKDEISVTHINLNDNTVEGLECKNRPVFSIQYHPEASPGPHDSRYLFIRFLEMIKNSKD